jgi:hypothetical protein
VKHRVSSRVIAAAIVVLTIGAVLTHFFARAERNYAHPPRSEPVVLGALMSALIFGSVLIIYELVALAVLKTMRWFDTKTSNQALQPTAGRSDN